LCHVKRIEKSLQANLDTAGFAIDELHKALKKHVKLHYNVSVRIEKFRLDKVDECTRTYKKEKWPFELQNQADEEDDEDEDGDDGNGTQKKNEGEVAARKKSGGGQSSGSTRRRRRRGGSSSSSGSTHSRRRRGGSENKDDDDDKFEARSKKEGKTQRAQTSSRQRKSEGSLIELREQRIFKQCCCKLPFGDPKKDPGANDGSLSVMSSCKRQFKCQGSKFPQKTDETICKYADDSTKLKVAVKGLKGNAIDAEKIYERQKND
jgi:hypothetical protein